MEISFIKDNEHEKCNEFYNKTYSSNRNMKQWNWEFCTICKDNLPFTVVKENDAILGVQALIPIKLIDKNGVFLSAKSEETLLDQSLRGKGVFKDMYELLFKYAEENKIEIIWGFTHAVNAFKKVGFKVPGETSQLFMPLSTKSLEALNNNSNEATNQGFKNLILKIALSGAQLISKIKFSNKKNKYAKMNITIETMDKPPIESEQICKAFIKQWGGITILRDYDYLKWRIFDNPNIKPILKTVYIDSKLVGWIVYSVGHDYMGYILDLIVASSEYEKSKLEFAVEALIADAVESIMKTGAVGIRGWSINDHSFNLMVRKVSKRLGFYLIKKGEPIVMHSSNQNLLNDINNWYITRIFTEGLNG